MFILNVNCYADQAFGLLNKQGDLIFNKLAQEPESARERIYQWKYVIQALFDTLQEFRRRSCLTHDPITPPSPTVSS